MIIYDLKTMQRCEISENTVVALGTFDGCHLGHLSVLNAALNEAKKRRIKCAVYTFENIPRSSIERKDVPCIFTLDEKIKFIRKIGIDYIAIDNLENVRNMSGEEFFENVLKKSLHAACASCGFNYRFGKGAKWDSRDLCAFFEKAGGSVRISEEVIAFGKPLCSTLIREMIEKGEVEKILEFSPPYSIYAKVMHGKMLGRAIGIPTVNQKIPEGKVIPARGVYITECEIGEDVYPAVTNVGVRPTTDGKDAPENVETHIIGYEGNLYSSFVRVNFYRFLRSEKKFSSVEELKNQILLDEKSAKEYFGASGR